MAFNDYEFITKWRVAGTVGEVYNTLGDAEGLPQWWPSVYLGAAVAQEGDADGIGTVIDLDTKGFLPYTLKWSMTVTEANCDAGRIALDAHGDFDGRGVWTLVQDGDDVDITYDWRIRADKPLLKYLSFALKPFFAANHRWAMAKGLESLKLELLRRRAATAEEAAAVPAPPPVSKLDAKTASIGAGALLMALVGVAVVIQRKQQK